MSSGRDRAGEKAAQALGSSDGGGEREWAARWVCVCVCVRAYVCVLCALLVPL